MGAVAKNKYEPLELHLRAVGKGVKAITLSFAEVERILGFPLPASARAYRAWWGNQKETKGRPQAHAWLSAGFQVDTVSFSRGAESVRFRRHG